MTLYNCSACGSVHDSASPGCSNATVQTIGIGSMHPDLLALVEFRDAVLAWFENDDEMSRAIRDRTEDGRAAYHVAAEKALPLYDRMLALAQRWKPLKNIR